MTQYSKHGDYNLAVLDNANNFTEWMYEQIKPYLKGTILEIGSGRGTYAAKVARDFKKSEIIPTDIDKSYVKTLQKIGKAKTLDISDPKQAQKLKKEFQSINSAFSLNVLEHIKEDTQSLQNIYDLLAPNGTFAFLVPAHKWLYNRLDTALHHHRRYTKKEIRHKIAKTPFKIKNIHYFNALSILGWYVNGTLLKKEIIDENAMGFFNVLVPIVKQIEKHILRQQLGISLVVAVEKPEGR